MSHTVDESNRRMWDATAWRHHSQAMNRLRSVHERIGYMIDRLGRVDPTNLADAIAMPADSDARNAIGDLVDVAQRLALLDQMRDFEPVYRPDPSDGTVRLDADQSEALRALLGLVHVDEVARSWLGMLPAALQPADDPAESTPTSEH